MDKMTNVKALAFVLDTCELPTEVKEKLTNLHTTLSKKSAGNHKPTAKQEANLGLIETIYDGMKSGRWYTVAEISTEILGGEYSSQKVSALLKKMVDIHTVTRLEIKRKPYFCVYEGEDNIPAQPEG